MPESDYHLLVVNAARHLLMVPPISKMNAHSLSSRPLVPVLQNGLFPIFYEMFSEFSFRRSFKKCKHEMQKNKKNFSVDSR